MTTPTATETRIGPVARRGIGAALLTAPRGGVRLPELRRAVSLAVETPLGSAGRCGIGAALIAPRRTLGLPESQRSVARRGLVLAAPLIAT
ncbi:MAG TPA: hypothetical protein VGN81_18255, partial [Pseudonocardiaceae bacterium]